VLLVVGTVTYGLPRILRPDLYPGEEFASCLVHDLDRASCACRARARGKHPRMAEERTKEEVKRDRQMTELLQELRIALPGVQILFAFLLTVPFAQGFAQVTDFQRDLYFATLLATTASTACLIAPSATHRLRFHQRERAYIVESANRLLIAGLVFLAGAIVCAVTLITDYLFGLGDSWMWPAAVAVAVIVLWFVRPLLRHLRGLSSGP
jgi:cobalamin synthase